MNLLRFNLIYQEHPYPKDPRSNFDKWGQICIFLLKEKTSERIEILDTQWDLSSLIEWFYKKVDITPSLVFQIDNNIQVLPQESLAQAEFRLRQADYDDDDDSIFDTLYEFRENNALSHQHYIRNKKIFDYLYPLTSPELQAIAKQALNPKE